LKKSPNKRQFHVRELFFAFFVILLQSTMPVEGENKSVGVPDSVALLLYFAVW
jgi:hypothetical protein